MDSTENDTFEFTYTVEPQDFAKAIRQFGIRAPRYLLLTIGAVAGAGITALALIAEIVLQLVGAENSAGAGPILCPLACIGLWLFFPAYFFFLRPAGVVRHVKKHPQALGPHTCYLDTNKLTIVSPQATSELQWSLFQQFKQAPLYYYLIYTSNRSCFQFIPKRAFTTPEQEAQFRRYVEAALGPIK